MIEPTKETQDKESKFGENRAIKMARQINTKYHSAPLGDLSRHF